jgi:hypothetical protein
MTYREHDVVTHVHPEIDVVPTRARIRILNGTKTEIVIPCSYVTPAVAPATEDTYTVIDLTAEGYADPTCSLASDAPTGLSATATIDATDHSVIRLLLIAACADAITTDIDCEISVTITRTVNAATWTDSVLRGSIHVEAAPITVGGGQM